MSEATPRPWRVEDGAIVAEWPDVGDVQLASMNTTRWSYEGRGMEFNERMSGQRKANAELIVRAVNLHDELVGLLKDIDWDEDGTPSGWPNRERVDAALAKAEAIQDGVA